MSYAIIRTGGKQFRVEPGKTYRIPSLVGEPGSKLTFSDVLLGSDGDKTHVGAPGLERRFGRSRDRQARSRREDHRVQAEAP